MLKHKKLLSALLAALMLFTVTGCGGNTDGDAEEGVNDTYLRTWNGGDRQYVGHRRDG